MLRPPLTANLSHIQAVQRLSLNFHSCTINYRGSICQGMWERYKDILLHVKGVVLCTIIASCVFEKREIEVIRWEREGGGKGERQGEV